MEKAHLEVTEKHLGDNAVIGRREQGFMKGKSCLVNLIYFHDKVVHLIDQGKPGEVVGFGVSLRFWYCLSQYPSG